MTMAGAPLSRRNGNLDALRALAIALVVIFHIEGYANFPTALHFVRGWWCGVDLFFVLSGYLVGGLAIKEIMRDDRLRIGHFLARRWWRTIPPYLIALIAVYTVKVLMSQDGIPFHWEYLVFIQNYTFPAGLPYFGVSWTLCVEEQFYVLLPLLLFGVGRQRLPIAIGVIALTSVVVPLVSRLLVAGSPWQATFEYATHHYCAGLGVGVWLAWVMQRGHAPGRGQRMVIGAGAGVALAFMVFYFWLPFSRWGEFVVGRMLLVAACGMLVYAAVTLDPWRGSSSFVVRSLASWSYSIYLTHMPVVAAITAIMAGMTLPLVVVSAASLSLIVGAVFWLVAEKPAFWLRERFAPQDGQHK